MKVFNRFAIESLDAENGARTFPNADQVVVGSSVETTTDGAIVLERTWGLNAAGDMITRTVWSVQNPPVLTALSADLKRREVNSVTLTGSNLGVTELGTEVLLEYWPLFSMTPVPGAVTSANGETRFFRLKGTVTAWSSGSITVSFNLKDLNDIPHPTAGPAKIVLHDLTRDLEEYLTVAIVEPPQSDNWGFAEQPRNP